jgi:lipopolysaccharide transport system permease protein
VTDLSANTRADSAPAPNRQSLQMPLAARPVIHIGARRAFSGANLRELWDYRELLYFLTWRDVKIRYKQTAFGGAWAVLQPLLLMGVFAVFLGKLARVPSAGLPYPIFVYAALVPWTLFAQSLVAASESLTRGAALVSKVYFPRLLLPIGAATALVFDFCISMALLFAMMLAYGITPTADALWLPALVLLSWLTALGVGIWLAALNVRYRDVRQAVPFLVQVWLFLSPVAYPSSLVPENWRWLYGLNPIVGVVEGFRWALLGAGSTPSGLILASAVVTIAVLAGGLIYFQRTERTFADII